MTTQQATAPDRPRDPALGDCGDGPHLHEPHEAAVMLRTTESALMQMVYARKVPFTRLGSKTRFSDEDLRQIIQGAARRPTSPSPARPRTTRPRRRT